MISSTNCSGDEGIARVNKPKPEKPTDEEGIDILEILGLAVNQLEAEGRGVVPKREVITQRQDKGG